MDYNAKIKVLIAIASFAVISIFFTTEYRRRRKQKSLPSSCYLQTDLKPQSTFKRVLADNSYSPFKHLKLNDSNNENSSNLHPYEPEVTALIENPQFKFNFGTDYMDLKMCDSYVWVETESQLKELVDVLTKETAFAVDTEQHSLRSFLGFTALIQISTQKEDYLVDTIQLRDLMGVLRPVFADPNICKVFHGADNDVLWLQRDFHIYVVNLFDTGKACEVLSKPQKSLAYLLETYCGVATNKLLQREDWRQRPLSVEMVQYARTDAHYLLFIANCLVSELKQHYSEKSSCADDELYFVLEASRRSNTICLQLYTKDIEATPGESAASSILSRHLSNSNEDVSSFSGPQFQDLIRRLCTWRDLMARIHDESLRYVLSDQAIVALAYKVPTTFAEVCGTIAEADLSADSLSFNSFLPSPSPLVCSHFDDFYYLYEDKIGSLDDIFSAVLKKHLGPTGSCPLTVLNYALLVNWNLRLKYQGVSKQNGVKNSKKIARKASRQLFVEKFSCKSPVYHNCRIYANDGRLLCYCDRRKLEWYLRRDLAKLVDDNPLAIMLLFEPKGRPEDEDNDFYIQSKKNICVGCGESNHYLRYRIIPSCYRMHFPEHLKSHRSHDIVLVCVDCHEAAHSAAEKYKKQIAAEFGIPLFISKVVDPTQAQSLSGSSVSEMNAEAAGVSPLQLRTAAMALLRYGPNMPSMRREELTQIVRTYYGGRELSQEDLERALLVGMSPHERRRLVKKKGMSARQSTRRNLPEDALYIDTLDNSDPPKAEPSQTGEDINLLIGMDTDIKPSSRSNLGLDGDSSATVCRSMDPDKNVDESVCTGNDVDQCANRSPTNGTADLLFPKSNSKLSLLGHGPHGKQVVEYLLNEYGDDGIRQFCQRWRQVFVEAIHPRFLPAGWDVTHSGRRDFGEFSVFNPAKKASNAAGS